MNISVPDFLQSSNSMPGTSFDDDFIMDFNDSSLFNSLMATNFQIDFPNPREIGMSC